MKPKLQKLVMEALIASRSKHSSAGVLTDPGEAYKGGEFMFTNPNRILLERAIAHLNGDGTEFDRAYKIKK